MTQPITIGLTGSIAMGKSTTASMFVDEGIPVWDADATVRKLYDKGGAAVEPIAALCPDALTDGMISRETLSQWIARDPTAIKKIEAIVHPLVAADRRQFLAQTDAPIVLLDIPLLFETGGHKAVDKIVVVTAPPDVQRARAMARPGMTETHFNLILSRQKPDAEKRARADYVIETDTLEKARAQVQACLADIREQMSDA